MEKYDANLQENLWQKSMADPWISATDFSFMYPADPLNGPNPHVVICGFFTESGSIRDQPLILFSNTEYKVAAEKSTL